MQPLLGNLEKDIKSPLEATVVLNEIKYINDADFRTVVNDFLRNCIQISLYGKHFHGAISRGAVYT